MSVYTEEESMSWSDRKLLELQGEMWRAEARGARRSWLYRHFPPWPHPRRSRSQFSPLNRVVVR